MKYIIFSIALICLVFLRLKKKAFHNPYVIFNLLWLCVSGLLIVGNKFVYTPNKIAMLCILIGVISFNMSFFSPKLIFGKVKLFSKEITYTLNSTMANYLSVLVLIYSIITSIYAIKTFLSGESFAVIREDYYNYTSTNDVFMYYLRGYVVSPLRYVIIVAAIISLYKGEKNKVLLTNTVLIVLLQAVTSGGRYVLMNALLMFVCGFFIFGGFKKIKLKQKIILAIIAIAIGYFVIFLTNDRTTTLAANMNTMQRLYLTIYQYFVGSVTYLGKVIDRYPTVVGSTYGVNFLCGFIEPIFVAFSFLKLIPHPEIFNIIGTYACEQMLIGPYSYYNAMPTMFGYFFIDGGIILVFIESWLFGYVCKRLYIRAEKGNLLFVAFYILIFVQICNSSTRWFFYSSEFCLAFIYMRLVLKKNIT